MKVDLIEILKGTTKNFKYEKMTLCSGCKGTKIQNKKTITCKFCDQAGVTVNEQGKRYFGDENSLRSARTRQFEREDCSHCSGLWSM